MAPRVAARRTHQRRREFSFDARRLALPLVDYGYSSDICFIPDEQRTSGVSAKAVRNVLQGHEGCTHLAGAAVSVRSRRHWCPVSDDWERKDRPRDWLVRSSGTFLSILRNAASNASRDQTCYDAATRGASRELTAKIGMIIRLTSMTAKSNSEI